MDFFEYLPEDFDFDELHRDFGRALSQVFSPKYLNKVQRVIKKNILIKSKDFKDPSKVAYVVGRTIYVNSPVFDRLSSKDRVNYLLHELIHILQNTKNFLIFKAFKEVFDLGKVVYKIIRKNLKGNLNIFLTGSSERVSNAKLEVISYFMNGSLDWTQLEPKGREEILNAFIKSEMFNLESKFWKDRFF